MISPAVSGGPAPHGAGVFFGPNAVDERRHLLGLEGMSRECRDLWGLILAGLSYREIGTRLGVTEGALRVRALRCRQRAAEVAGRNIVAERTPK